MASQDLRHQLANQLILQSNAKLIAPCAGPPSGIGKTSVLAQPGRRLEMEQRLNREYTAHQHLNGLAISHLHTAQGQKNMRGASLNAVHATPALNAKAEHKLPGALYFSGGRQPPATLTNQPEDIICTGTAQLPAASKYKSAPPAPAQPPAPGATFFSSGGSAARAPGQPSRQQHRARLVSMVKGLGPLPRPSLHQALESRTGERRAQGSAPTEPSAAVGSGSTQQTAANAAQAAASQRRPDSRGLSKGASKPAIGVTGRGGQGPEGGLATLQGQPSRAYESAQQLISDQHRREHHHHCQDHQEGQPAAFESTPQKVFKSRKVAHAQRDRIHPVLKHSPPAAREASLASDPAGSVAHMTKIVASRMALDAGASLSPTGAAPERSDALRV